MYIMYEEDTLRYNEIIIANYTKHTKQNRRRKKIADLQNTRPGYCKKSLTSSSSRALACLFAHRASATLGLSPHRSWCSGNEHAVLGTFDFLFRLAIDSVSENGIVSDLACRFNAGQGLPAFTNGGSRKYFFKHPWW